ncbi:MAG: M13 family metallopeptidase [Acidobacteriota bacterium]|nr:M13 family metallopeptidase [Acidobacteriota bacterium]
MPLKDLLKIASLLTLCPSLAGAQATSAGGARAAGPAGVAGTAETASAAVPGLPYTPGLDLQAMDRGIDPCVDFYRYACGGWMKSNPIPPDQTSWSIYGKLHNDNFVFLRQVLETASRPDPQRDTVSREIGDYYAACMDEAAIERRGLHPIGSHLVAIGAIRTADALAVELARLQQETGAPVLFSFGSGQDYHDATQVIAVASQGGLGLPDRDYYLKDDAKSAEVRQRYLGHVQRMFEFLGEKPESAAADARTVLRLETALAKVSLDRVERRTPSNLYHRMSREQLAALTPSFSWNRFFALQELADLRDLNVAEPAFFTGLEALLKSEPLAGWQSYMRWHLINALADELPARFAKEQFDFYRGYLRGAQEIEPRWRRCVQSVDRSLGEALGKVYVDKAFSPEARQRTLKMVQEIEREMETDLQELSWMSPATKQQAQRKLHSLANKIGYPDRFRDYSSIHLVRNDFVSNVLHSTRFESKRQLEKIGKPVDRDEWDMTPPTVNAEYSPLQNEMYFPAGVLQPPLFDPRMDDAPNYGNTGSTIGHELTHGFDDEGRQFDFAGNLRDWWAESDAKEFERRAGCIADQYAQYTVVGDVKINSKLTLGEDVADLGGEMLAYRAWKNVTRGQTLKPIDGLTPEQRFFVGYGQSWCSNRREADDRLRAATDPHSPPQYRANGVVANTPEFRQAFSCKPGQPMAPEKVCRVW